MRASGGPSILKELSNERIALDLEDAARMNVHAVAVQAFVGGEFETQSIENLTTARRRRLPIRHPRPRRHGGRQGAGPRRALSRARDAHLRRARRAGGEDLLLRGGIRAGDCRLPGADRDGRRQEVAGARRARDGLPSHPGGRSGRRHGPKHLPERRSGRDAPGGRARSSTRMPARRRRTSSSRSSPRRPRVA